MPYIQDNESQISIEIVKSVTALTIASLGGGLISSGFIIKAQIEHNNESLNLKSSLKSLEKQMAEVNLIKEENGNEWTEEQHSNYVGLLIMNSRERTKIIDELKCKSQVDKS